MRTGSIAGQHQHDMMIDVSHDELAYQQFVQTYLADVNGRLLQGLQPIVDPEGTPGSIKQVTEQRRRYLKHPYGQMWSSLRRIGREFTCEAVGPSVERQLPELIEKARKYRSSNRKLGSLQLDPSIKAPRYNTEIEIHCKPGGYHTELTEDDVFAGAEYDRTTYLNTSGRLGPLQDFLGKDVGAWIKRTYPDLKPKRILEMGCTIGQSTIGWTEVFPDAEIYGIDVAAPCLRYGHARSEALGRKIHFSQQDAEKTSFPDNYFDLVVSHAMIHETATKALHNIFAETLRILKPGGVMAHNDGAPFRDLTPLGRVVPDWDTHFNAEPFITKLRGTDLTEWAIAAGWKPGSVRNAYTNESSAAEKGNQIGGAGFIVAGRK